MTQLKYFQFPLIMLREVHKNYDRAMQDIINYAVVGFALKQNINLEDAARELIYSYYRDRSGAYEPAMEALADRFEKRHLETYEDYIVFGGDGEVNHDTVGQVSEYLGSDNELRTLAIQNKQLRNINSFFNIQGSTSDNPYFKYQKLKKTIEVHQAKHGRDPHPTILTDLFWDLYQGKDPVLFAGYMAIRSIEGHNTYAATNRPTIAGRMAGAKSLAVIKKLEPSERAIYEKYAHRYHFYRLLERLYKRGILKSVLRQKNWRHIYLSTRLSADELGEAVARQANKRKLNDAINEAKQAYDKQNTSSL